jgi:hypothetical protein
MPAAGLRFVEVFSPPVSFVEAGGLFCWHCDSVERPGNFQLSYGYLLPPAVT